MAGYNDYLRRGRRGDRRAGPALPRQGVGAADHRDRRLPALLPARAARQLGRRGRRHRAGAAADAGARRRPASSPPLPTPGDLGRCRTGCRSATSAPTRSRSARRRPTTTAGPAARQPALPVGRARALLPGALTIPGKVDVAGASLFGVPLVLIGHTRKLAWSHTVSTAFRFTPFELKLVPGSPTTYLVDGAAARDDARRRSRCRCARPTARSSRARARSTRPSYGPVFTVAPRAAAVPLDARDRLRDGRRERHQLPRSQPLLRGQPGAEHRASSTRSSAATRASRGSTRSPPTRAARAYYADIGTMPNVTDEKAARCNTTALGAATFQLARAAGARRLARGVRLGQRPRRGRARDPRPGAHAVAVPRRLRDELQRLLLALEPGAAARGLRPDHRRRAHGALAAHAPRAADRRRPAARDGRVHAAGPAGRRLQQPPARRRAVARRARRDAAARSRTSRRRATCSAGWDLHDDLDSRGAVLFRRFASRLLGGGRAARRDLATCRSTRPTRSTRRAG